MTGTEIIEFILPQRDDPLQVVFLALILGMMGFTIVAAHLTARPKSWLKKWDRGTPDDHTDDLDIDHGSVTDLWHAVSTAPEKLAEIMPGMLLVVGLLGTFLGLGLALNNASNILGQPDAMSAAGAAGSMQELLNLLQGLGTKFKTSTWGITGFVLLKIWAELTRFEEKRLAWVISKVKTELEHRKQREVVTANEKQKALFDTIAGSAREIVSGFSKNFTSLIESDRELHKHALRHLSEGVKGIREDLNRVQADTAATHLAMEQFTDNTQAVVENMAGASQRMAGGADKVGDAANQLNVAIEAFKDQFTDVLDKVREDLGAAIQNMSTQASNTLERGSAQLGDATREISQALGVLSDDVKQTMSEVKIAIEKAHGIQTKATLAFTQSTQVLDEQIKTSTTTIEKLGEPISQGLKSVSQAGQHMRGIGKALDDSLQTMHDVVAHLVQVPAAFEPIKDLTAAQLALVHALEPLNSIPAHQQAVRHELEQLRNSLAGLSEWKTATDSALA